MGISCLALLDGINVGHTGVLLRGAGSKNDLRRFSPYEIYKNFVFQTPIGRYGDSYDRYLIRVEEMFQSINIIEQAINLLPFGEHINRSAKATPPSREDSTTSMESAIEHFKFYSEGVKIAKNELFSTLESPKGEFGIFLVSNGTTIPERCKIRAAGFFHLSSINNMLSDHFLSDATTVIGTQDLVFGEVDR